MKIAQASDQITPLSIGSKVPNGTLEAMDASKTTLYDIIQDKPAVIIFYRGIW